MQLYSSPIKLLSMVIASYFYELALSMAIVSYFSETALSRQLQIIGYMTS